MKRSWIRRGKKPLVRTKPIRKVSAKRAKENREYSAARKVFLAEHPVCRVMLVVNTQTLPAVDIHHMAGRSGKMLLDQRHWMAVSREGHDFIHRNPNYAREMGWLK